MVAGEDLIRLLLHPDPDERLTSLTNGGRDVMDHPFFKPIDFDALKAKKIGPFTSLIRLFASLRVCFNLCVRCGDCVRARVLVCAPCAWVVAGVVVSVRLLALTTSVLLPADPPFEPEVEDDEDISNFEEPEEPEDDIDAGDMSIDPADFAGW